jgi:hypothetical protein
MLSLPCFYRGLDVVELFFEALGRVVKIINLFLQFVGQPFPIRPPGCGL